MGTGSYYWVADGATCGPSEDWCESAKGEGRAALSTHSEEVSRLGEGGAMGDT